MSEPIEPFDSTQRNKGNFEQNTHSNIEELREQFPLFTDDYERHEAEIEWWKKFTDDTYISDVPARSDGWVTNTPYSPYCSHLSQYLDMLHRGGDVVVGKNAVGLYEDEDVSGKFVALHVGNKEAFWTWESRDTKSETPHHLLAYQIGLVRSEDLRLVDIKQRKFISHWTGKDPYAGITRQTVVCGALKNFLLVQQDHVIKEKPFDLDEVAEYELLRQERYENGNTLYVPFNLEQFYGLALRGVQERIDLLSDEQLHVVNEGLGLLLDGARPYKRSEDHHSQYSM